MGGGGGIPRAGRMSPLKCHTVHEAIWERAASAGPAPLTPALAEHLTSCGACQAEGRAVADLLEVARTHPTPPPPVDIWEGFDEELHRQLSAAGRAPTAWQRYGRRITSMAAVLVVGFALGLAAARLGGSSEGRRAAADRAARLAELAEDAQLEAYLLQVEERLAADRAGGPLPQGLVAGPGVPSAEAGERMARAAVERERLRMLLLAALAVELEAESRGFGYLDRRIATLAGQHFLYLVP
jgi:hypothetical protein